MTIVSLYSPVAPVKYLPVYLLPEAKQLAKLAALLDRPTNTFKKTAKTTKNYQN